MISDQEFWGYKDYGANLLAKLTPTRGLEYYAGYDFQNYSGEDAVLLIAPNTETVNAVFGQVRTTRDLLGNATMTAGVRFNAPSESENHTVWNVTGQYDFPKAMFAGATVGTSFRYPDAYELFAIDPFCCFGNPNPRGGLQFHAREFTASRSDRSRAGFLLGQPERQPRAARRREGADQPFDLTWPGQQPRRTAARTGSPKALNRQHVVAGSIAAVARSLTIRLR